MPEFQYELTKASEIRILTICGSLRAGSLHQRLLATLPEVAPKNLSFEQAPSFRDVPAFDDDDKKAKGVPKAIEDLAEAIRKVDGVVIASPEYNHSIPGGLKNALDWLSRLDNQPLKGRPVALQSVSPGPGGGVRGQMALRQTLLFFQANVLSKPEVLIGIAGEKFNDQVLIDKMSREFVAAQLVEFVSLVLSTKHVERNP
ncbi:MAG: NAD(P)H-dependent oxidoreductase [Proteobacteria bacterium]|nr:NAD(P)H-dependent oxidoreductase [Pseudomonadota bacterium]